MTLLGAIEKANKNYKCSLCGFSSFGYINRGELLYCKYCGRYIKELKIIRIDDKFVLNYERVGEKIGVD